MAKRAQGAREGATQDTTAPFSGRTTVAANDQGSGDYRSLAHRAVIEGNQQLWAERLRAGGLRKSYMPRIPALVCYSSSNAHNTVPYARGRRRVQRSSRQSHGRLTMLVDLIIPAEGRYNPDDNPN
jgi:hypothetical protein